MKRIIKLLKLIYKISISRSKFGLVKRDWSKKLDPIRTDDEHLKKSIEWLLLSHEVTGNRGSSGIYTFHSEWEGPYPETTGYIIPTLLQYYDITKESVCLENAIAMADWELDIQLESGAIRGGVGINDYPIVFNTGQVMIGWLAIYRHTNNEKYIDAAERAADWLVSNMDEDGKWSKNTYNNIPHAYNVRVTWALLDVGLVKDNHTFINAAKLNIQWVLSNSKQNGWIDYMEFTPDEDPFTHTIAYTLRGLLECSLLLDGSLKEEITDLVSRASSAIIQTYSERQSSNDAVFSMLPGTMDKNWRSNAKYSCLTGNAQMAIILLKLYRINNNEVFLESALKMIDQVKSTQKLESSNKGIQGGVAGSYPVWGGYIHYGYPNWAAKFFADALLLKKEILKEKA